MKTSKMTAVPKHRNSASRAHFTPRQLELKASWERRRKAEREQEKTERGMEKTHNSVRDLAKRNSGVEFHEKFKRATGEEPTSDLIDAYGCSGPDWRIKLNEIERLTWGTEDEGIRRHVEAELRIATRKSGSAISLRQVYCEVAERLDVFAGTFEAAIKRVEKAYKSSASANRADSLGVVGRLAIEVQEGYRILDPQTKKPMLAGRLYDVPNSPYWRRRLREGGVRKLSI